MTTISPRSSNAFCAALLVSASALAGCGGKPAGPATPQGAPIEVGVVTLAAAAVPVSRELPGRTAPFRIAEVRARVTGIVLKRLFEEGSDVKEGQPLFHIDPAPYQAAFDAAAATRAHAEAAAANAKLVAARTEDLVKDNAVSRQEADAAAATLQVADADLAAARAAERMARLNLGYTTVTSPVTGRIGRAVVTEGAYVQSTQANLMATVQQLDPIYVDLSQSADEVLRLRRDLESGRIQGTGQGKASVKLVTGDGREYGQPGTLQFADVTVDPSTGSLGLRALFPNPKGELLPGLFVRAKLEQGVASSALLVPQAGVTRDQKGQPLALVVGADNKVERRPLAVERTVGDAWLVTEGVKAGDQVIVEGLQKVRPGALVTPVAAGAKATPPGAPPAGPPGAAPAGAEPSKPAAGAPAR